MSHPIPEVSGPPTNGTAPNTTLSVTGKVTVLTPAQLATIAATTPLAISLKVFEGGHVLYKKYLDELARRLGYDFGLCAYLQNHFLLVTRTTRVTDRTWTEKLNILRANLKRGKKTLIGEEREINNHCVIILLKGVLSKADHTQVRDHIKDVEIVDPHNSRRKHFGVRLELDNVQPAMMVVTRDGKPVQFSDLALIKRTILGDLVDATLASHTLNAGSQGDGLMPKKLAKPRVDIVSVCPFTRNNLGYYDGPMAINGFGRAVVAPLEKGEHICPDGTRRACITYNTVTPVYPYASTFAAVQLRLYTVPDIQNPSYTIPRVYICWKEFEVNTETGLITGKSVTPAMLDNRDLRQDEEGFIYSHNARDGWKSGFDRLGFCTVYESVTRMIHHPEIRAHLDMPADYTIPECSVEVGTEAYGQHEEDQTEDAPDDSSVARTDEHSGAPQPLADKSPADPNSETLIAGDGGA